MDWDEESKRLNELFPDNPMRGKTATEALPIYHQRRMKRFENSSLHWRLSDARQYIFVETLALAEQGLHDRSVYDAILSRQQVEIDELRLKLAKLEDRLAMLMLGLKEEGKEPQDLQ